VIYNFRGATGEEMAKVEFDAESFYAALDSQRQSQRLTWKEVAAKSEVSASTLTRMAQGKRPDVDSLTALLKLHWKQLSKLATKVYVRIE
jgi:predicted transcriptional regulator